MTVKCIKKEFDLSLGKEYKVIVPIGAKSTLGRISLIAFYTKL